MWNASDKIDLLPVDALNITSLALLAEMHREIFEPVGERHWTIKEFQNLASLSTVDHYLIVINTDPVGLASISKVVDEAEILTIGILPTCQNMNLGRRAMKLIIASLKRTGIKKVYLEVRNANIHAISMYNHLGFEHTGKRVGYYKMLNNTFQDADLMSLAIV